jgi:hypothetical protein
MLKSRQQFGIAAILNLVTEESLVEVYAAEQTPLLKATFSGAARDGNAV